VNRTVAIKSLVALAVGVLLFLSCADFDIWPLTWFALVPLFFVLFSPTTKRPWFYGLLTGLTANGGGFYWMVGFFERFAHLPRIASLPIFALLIAYQAITFAVFAWLVRRLRDHTAWPLIALAPISYVAVELVVPYVFPWYLAITQAWVRPVVQIAELTGPLGVSGLLLMINAALYEGARAAYERRRPPVAHLIAAASVLAACLGFGALRIHQVTEARARAPKAKVGVVQANIGITEKWDPRMALDHLTLHQRLSSDLEAKGADLIVWPESAYSFGYLRSQMQDYPETDGRRARRGMKGPLLLGALTFGSDMRQTFNSALMIDPNDRVVGRFDKTILMVFGEYIPYYQQLRFIQQWIPEASNLDRGQGVNLITLDRPGAPPLKIGPMICYEDIFPSFGRRLARLSPNLLINMTNDAWFGRTSEPWEHMALSVYRAVELRLDLIRAVNTGVSTLIDATGRVVESTTSVDPAEHPAAPPMTLLEEVALLEPVQLYARTGEWFGALCLLIAVILGIRALAHAGRPIAWRIVARGSIAFVIALVPTIAVFAGPSNVGLALGLMLRRPLGV
jgi:apolipoprotein N-acyltransferase